MAITLKEIRATALDTILHVASGDGRFAPARLDRGWRYAGNDFVQRTLCTRTVTDVSISSGSHVVNLRSTSGLDNFIEPSFIWAHIAGSPVKRAPLHTVQRAFAGSTPTGKPTMIALESPTRAWLYPEPDASYTLSIQHAPPFTASAAWTVGQSDDSITFNIPDQYVDAVIRTKMVPWLTFVDPDAPLAQAAAQQYEQLVAYVASQYENEATGQRVLDPKTFKRPQAKG